MNTVQRNKSQNIEKFPGCLGRMVNLFDLSTGIPANRMLTEKPHQDGSSLSRSQSNVYGMLTTQFEEQSEEQKNVSDLKRTQPNKNVGGTPIKTLIDREMLKEVESKQHNPPNLVAKLMGLDSLPKQQPSFASRQGYPRDSRHSSSFSWEQDEDLLKKGLDCEVHASPELNEFKDVYEIWQDSESQKQTYGRTCLTQNVASRENLNEKKLALVRQKFTEAKRLVTDEKLRQSKEFQDAMEVLSSNRDIFLKFLEGPNPMYSQSLCNLQSMARPHETKRITVLRPSKTVDGVKFVGKDKRGGNQTKRSTQIGKATGWDRNGSVLSPISSQKIDAYPAQPTRIVVLKPSTGMAQENKALVSPSSSSPGILHGRSFYEETEYDVDDVRESREVAKLITLQMQENLVGHRMDETLLSSVFSNGYIGDDSSFNKSENDYTVGNLSDSEVMSPTSRHSWDYINRAGSPLSSSSFSRASCSPESSVCREAKKRLSERWALMASNGSSQEQRHVRRSSSTLGEMLALYDSKKSIQTEDGVHNKENKPRGSISCLESSLHKDESMDASPKNLLRSKSVPVSSTVYGARLDVEVSAVEDGKVDVPKELLKAKSTKSTLRGKVSSLFFSKSRKHNKEKLNESETMDGSQSATPETPRSPVILTKKFITDARQTTGDIEECSSPGLFGSPGKTPFRCLDSIGAKPGILSPEGGLSVAKPIIPVAENQDQPSPISVLEPPFEEDDNVILGRIKSQYQGMEVLPMANLIDKSPPIGSIARTLSWGDASIDSVASFAKPPSVVSPCNRGEEQDWVLLVQMLLSAAGLGSEVMSSLVMGKWHSPESPLDPSLRDKFAAVTDTEPLQEAKRRQWRSSRKLVFDCVNTALAEMSGFGAESSIISSMSFPDGDGEGTMVVDYVWAHMKDWFRCSSEGVGGEVERMVQKEVVGNGWGDHMKVELEKLGKDIEGRLVQELVEEAVVDLTKTVLQ